MLEYLKIENLALIDTAEVEWAEGFTAITGETGAGKSVLIGALELLAGAKGDKSRIRKDAEYCEVEAVVRLPSSSSIDALLETHGLSPCEESSLLLKRRIHQTRAGRVHINGSLASIAALKALGDKWIDFHTPGEHQHLLEENRQLKWLDLYANHPGKLASYREHYEQKQALSKQIDALKKSEQLSPEAQSYIEGQIKTMDALNLDEEAIVELENAFHRTQNEQTIRELAHVIEAHLSGESSAMDHLYHAQQQTTELAEHLPETKEAAQRLQSAIIELEDIAGHYSDIAKEETMDPETLADIQERMQQWLELKRRYGPEPEQVRAERNKLADKLASQSDIEGTLKQLHEQYDTAHAALLKAGNQLQASREKASQKFCKAVNQLLPKLGLKQAHMQFSFPTESKPQPHGTAAARMLFQPNPGSDPLPLNKIASSGEAARLMLAIKTVLAEKDQTPVLVFDEVDANVGGEIGAEVGTQLASLGERHQVACITHLPQVAAQAKQHLSVRKSNQKKETLIHLEDLSGDKTKRTEEIARMLGARNSQTALQHASELLQPHSE